MRTPGRCLYQPSNVDQVPTEDEYQAIARQFGLFLRRAYHFHQDLQLHADGPHLERAADHKRQATNTIGLAESFGPCCPMEPA